MEKIFTRDENDFDAINAIMCPDFQISKMKDGAVMEVVDVLQTEATDRNGNDKTSTTFIDKDGKSYQTLSDYVDRLVHTLDQKIPAVSWKEKPMKFTVGWRKTNNNQNMLVLTVG